MSDWDDKAAAAAPVPQSSPYEERFPGAARPGGDAGKYPPAAAVPQASATTPAPIKE